MKKSFSIVVPSYNSGKFLQKTLLSILSQREYGTQLELIVVDGGSTDETPEILNQFRDDIDRIVIGADTGPANAINKGFALATGDILSWLNADDVYMKGALDRVEDFFNQRNQCTFGFGRCTIIDERDTVIRSGITRFKEMFFPVNSRFVYQCINYISQPATFFSREAYTQAGGLREDMIAAWDYEFFIRLWRYGKAGRIDGDPVAAFRWHPHSISGQNFTTQFKEELDVAAADAGKFSLQFLLHQGVRFGIVTIYSLMAKSRTISDKVS